MTNTFTITHDERQKIMNMIHKTACNYLNEAYMGGSAHVYDYTTRRNSLTIFTHQVDTSAQYIVLFGKYRYDLATPIPVTLKAANKMVNDIKKAGGKAVRRKASGANFNVFKRG